MINKDWLEGFNEGIEFIMNKINKKIDYPSQQVNVGDTHRTPDNKGNGLAEKQPSSFEDSVHEKANNLEPADPHSTKQELNKEILKSWEGKN